jgi:hypothetical protein
MFIIQYYQDAIVRSFGAALEWAVGQGLYLTIAFFVATFVVSVGRALWRNWPHVMTAFRAAIKDFLSTAALTTIVAVGLLFVVFFVLDAPNQANILNQKVTDLEATLKTKIVEPIAIDYKNERNWILRPQDRPGYNDWAVRVGVSVKDPLRRPRAYIVYADKLDKPRWGVPPIEVRGQLAWYQGPDSFNLDVIESHDYVVPFVASKDGKRLFLFTNTKTRELELLTRGIGPGNYKIVMMITGDAAVAQYYNILVHWPGNMNDFSMEISPGSRP